MWLRRGTGALSFLSLLLFGSSCTPFASEREIGGEGERTILQIKTLKSTNQGTPFYVVLKFTDFPNFLGEDYQAIARLGEEEGEDYKSFCVIPGMTKTIKIKPHKEKYAAVYFLFTNPSEDWKYLIEPQENVKNISISLGVHEINHIKTW